MMSLSRVTTMLVVGVSVVALALGGLLAACQPAAETQVEAQPDVNCSLPKEIEPMDLPETGALPNTNIPPIDASAPTETETATFSLG
jgi:hypothetical protein